VHESYTNYKQGATWHARGWLDAKQPGYLCSTAVELVTCRMLTTMKWWTVLVVAVVACAGAVKAREQETGRHSGPTAGDKGYVAGE
jgi:hypothetical protein